MGGIQNFGNERFHNRTSRLETFLLPSCLSTSKATVLLFGPLPVRLVPLPGELVANCRQTTVNSHAHRVCHFCEKATSEGGSLAKPKVATQCSFGAQEEYCDCQCVCESIVAQKNGHGRVHCAKIKPTTENVGTHVCPSLFPALLFLALGRGWGEDPKNRDSSGGIVQIGGGS